METILIVDDEKNYPLVLSAVLEEEGFECLTASNGIEALEKLSKNDIDLVLTDIKMPGMDGIELMERIKDKNPNLPIICMTAHGSVEKGEEAVKKGAHNYIFKPFQNAQLILSVKIALNMYRVIKENQRLQNELETRYSFGNIIGKSKSMRKIYKTIQKVAPTTATVLIEGESGTGKELVARSIHFNSERRNKAFVAVNCAALAENLLESELFGHEKGAFTGAVSRKKGRFELADGGALFLDEIGEISLNMQVKLLRVLQEKVFESVGGVKPISVDVRLIAATNKKLKEQMSKGYFREDLFYRLNVVHISLPPLNNRYEDISLLAAHFIEKYKKEHDLNQKITGIDQDVMRAFYDYSWPGNVRELENMIERSMILCSGSTISLSDLPRDFRGAQKSFDLEGIPVNAPLSQTLNIIEKKMIKRALKISNNVQSHAAELLGMKKSLLHYKIKNYKIKLN
ncbi:Regulatory protein AtoC [Candidatus Magnetomoraceae bacterium gMMP-15]